MFGRRGIAAALVLASLGPARAAISIDSVVAEALANNPEVAAAEMKWRAAEATVVQRGWLPDPKLSVTYKQIPEGEYSPGAAGMRMLELSQAVPFPGKLFARADVARRAALVARSSWKQAKLGVANSARAAFYDYWLAHRTLEIKREERDIVGNFEKVAETGYALGQRPQHDVLDAQMQLAFIADELLALEEDRLPAARAKLNSVMDRPVDAPLDPPERPGSPRPTLPADELRRLTVDNQPELQAAQHRLEMSGAALALAAWDYAPDLMLGAMQERMTETGMTSYGVMLGVNVPLWFWSKNADIRAKSAERRGAEATVAATRSRVLAGLEADLAKVNAADRRLRLFETTVLPLAEQALESASMGYQTGAVDFLTLMSASRKLVDARLGFVRTRVELGKAMAMLEMRVGTDPTRGAE